MADGARGAILNGEHRVVRPALFQGQKGVLKLGQPGGLDPFAKEVDTGLLTVRPRLALEHHPGVLDGLPHLGQGLDKPGNAGVIRPFSCQVPLLAAGDGHNGLKEGGDAGAQVPLHQTGLVLEHLALSLSVQHRDASLQLVLAHLSGHRHALAEQLYHLSVNAVDFLSILLQFIHGNGLQ